MKKLTGNEVRAMFLEFFKGKGHMVEPGASLVPHSDPTLLWINSGVAALKKYFDGSEKPKSNRITNAQKSIRTNDIENVGKTARHHTFFEMLGNFSIGDYFKKDAILFAWEFLTSEEWMGFDKDKLYVTVYPDDDEAYDIWINTVKINPNRIMKTEENYWQIGEGPSGPCSEIHYDRGEAYDPDNLGEKLFFDELENDRYIEVWNIVFSQYDAKEGVDRKDFKELPQKNIDTGMGLERLVCLVQDGETNFDTDLFLPIIHETEKLAKYKYENEHKMAYRVIADHIRTVTFALADGASFSNEGRGYVLRRVLRRAVRYGKSIGIEGAFMYSLVQTVADIMEDFYPYVQDKVSLISKLVKTEEIAFHSTLKNGEKLLWDALENAKDSKLLKGDVIFKLYDTYGFPKELTIEIATDNGYKVDMELFDVEMKKQQERARSSRSDEQSMSSQSEDLMNFKSDFEFLGYEVTINTSKVVGLFKDGKKVDKLTDEGYVILEKTCFYAESGGQASDTGILYNDEFLADVVDCQKAPNNQHMHIINVKNGVIKVGDTVTAKVDEERRNLIKANHSSLHLLNSALHTVLGSHINQAGSYLNDEYGRFDFTHFEKVNDEKLKEIENLVNLYIMQDNEVITEVLPIEEALKSGAIAIFDEKYDDEVRVVSMGDASKEFCGGTHVNNTQEIGVFKIVSEESIGSGIRRIVSKTKMAAYKEMSKEIDRLSSIAKQMKLNSPTEIENKLNVILNENNELKKELSKQKEKMALLKADELIRNSEEINGLNVLIIKDNSLTSSNIKNFAETLKNKLKDSVVFISSNVDNKLVFACALSKTAVEKGLNAGKLIKLAASLSDGNGGGRNDLAQGGGKDITKEDLVLEKIKEEIKNI